MNFKEPLPQTFDLGFPLEYPISLRTRTGLFDFVNSNKVLQIMGNISETAEGKFWNPLYASSYEDSVLTEPFILWDADQDRKELPEVTCGLAFHLVQLDKGVWKVAYRQFLGNNIPRVCLNKMLTSMSDWLTNLSLLEPEFSDDGAWTRIADSRLCRMVFRSIRFALNENRPRR